MIQKNRLMFSLVLVFNLSTLNAQDTIFFANNKVLETKVLEVTEQVIKYKRYTNQDGPTYSVKRAEVTKIKYKSGTEDIFDHQDIIITNDKSQEKQLTSQKKFDINNNETINWVNEIALKAGKTIMKSCESKYLGSMVVDVYYDQTYEDEFSGDIYIAIIIKWTQKKNFDDIDYWITGTIKVTKGGKKTWSGSATSQKKLVACASAITDL